MPLMRLFYFTKTTLLSILAKRTIGVRALVLRDNKVLLVKHTYQTGWYTIGGAVDPGETTHQAIKRELYEEVGMEGFSLQLFSVYFSRNERRDDYIVFYIIQNGEQTEIKSKEIAEQRWFSLDDLPSDISPATRQRIEEYLGTTPVTEFW